VAVHYRKHIAAHLRANRWNALEQGHMPRRARIALPNIPVHIIQRGNNRQPCFFADEDYRRYLDWLAEYANMPSKFT